MQPLEPHRKNVCDEKSKTGLKVFFLLALSLISQTVSVAQEAVTSSSAVISKSSSRANILPGNTSQASAEVKANSGDDSKASAQRSAAARKTLSDEPLIARPSAAMNGSDETNAELNHLKEQVTEQQRQLDELRRQLEDQRKLIELVMRTPEPISVPLPAEGSGNAALSTISSGTQAAQKTETQEPSPLSFRLGSAYITPVGFMDFTAVFRSTNGGSGIGTNFGSVPFSNTAAGKLTELRLSAQNSRIGLRVDAKVKGADVIGYLESDFLGVLPGNIAVSSNSATNRLRLYWVDVRKGKLEFQGGQSWSFLTPNRRGLSPLPGDIFYTQDIDVNYQAGLVWSRDPQFRFVYHPSNTIAFGVSLENPEQYIGGSAGGGAVTLPSALATAYATQLDNGNTALSVPNLHPDIIAKIAFDPKIGKRDLHLEVAGVVRSFRVYNPLTQVYHSATGGGGSVNLNVELVKNFRFVTNNYYSDGGGRWIFGQAPDLIVKGDGSLSLIHASSTVTGVEVQASKNIQIYGYYGGVYIQRNVAIDPASGKPVGYGFAGSPNGQNRSIQQGTFGFTETFWRDPKYGALQLMGQYSYLIRKPWSVAAGQPGGAHTNIFFINLRYLLPGSAPKIK